MSENDIRARLRCFAEAIFRCGSFQEAHHIDKELNEFCQRYGVLPGSEIALEFEESGAAEVLYMLTSAQV